MDEEAEDIKDFAEGLMPALWVQNCIEKAGELVRGLNKANSRG